MKKIPTLFLRDFNVIPPTRAKRLGSSNLTENPNPKCDWVFKGEGVATRKWDGTCCLIRDGALYRRHEIKVGGSRPEFFEEIEYDLVTGKRQGWVPVQDKPGDRWHLEAWENTESKEDGTYELIGPKIQSNPEAVPNHTLVRHGWPHLPDAPRTYSELKTFFTRYPLVEGIVFHHPDGRMAKIRLSDFGIKRKPLGEK